MSTMLFANNAASTLAGSINNTAVQCTVESGGGALFPNPSANQYFVLTLIDAATGNQREIIHCTARTGDLFTIVRGQEGTTAQNWQAGDLVQMLPTAGTMEGLAQQSQLQQQAPNYAVDSGSANVITVTLSPAPDNLAALVGAPVRIKVANTTTTVNPVVVINGLSPLTIVNPDGTDLLVGQIPNGAIIELVSDGTNAQLVSITSVFAPPVIVMACYLKKVSTNLVLQRNGGNSIFVGGNTRSLSSSSVALAATGLLANTKYFIYAYWDGSAVQLEPSTTGYTVDADYGIPVKTGDASRSLVGAARTNLVSAATWAADDETGVGVISYYNRRNKAAWNNPASNVNVDVSAGTIEISALARTYFLAWNEDAIMASFWNMVANSVGGNVTNAFIGINGVGGSNIVGGSQLSTSHPTANVRLPITNGVAYAAGNIEDQINYLTIGGSASANVSTWYGNGGFGTSVLVRG